MPIQRVNQVNLFVNTTGEGEVMVFSHGYLMSHAMFDGQVKALSEHFTCVAYDQRGHGQSEATTSGYDMYNLVDDAIALIENLNVGAVHFVGMSTGGFVGMRIALKRPDLLKSLVLMDTSAGAEPPEAKKQYGRLLKAVKYLGWWAVLNKAMAVLFHPSFLQNPAKKSQVKQWKNIITGHNKNALIAFGYGIFDRDDVQDQLPSLNLPTAVIVGDEDRATHPEQAQAMAQAIPNARLYTIQQAGHTAAIEKPNDVAQAMLDFYEKAGFV